MKNTREPAQSRKTARTQESVRTQETVRTRGSVRTQETLRQTIWRITREIAQHAARHMDKVALVLVPVALVFCAWFKVDQTAILSTLIVVLALLPFVVRFERSKPKPRDIMPIIVLAALAVAGRILFAPFPNFKPVSAIIIMAGVCFGRQSGFMTGTLAALASNLFFGQGPWTPWQMYAWGCMAYTAGLLQDHGVFTRKWLVYAFGFLAPICYGLILDTYYFIGFVVDLNLKAALAVYSIGLTGSLIHAAATVTFLIPLFAPWSKKLSRLKKKYGIESGVT